MRENAGQPEKVERLLEPARSDPYRGSVALAVYYLCRGDLDRTVEWCGKAADQRYTGIVALIMRPFEPQLRQSAGWPALMKKVNLA